MTEALLKTGKHTVTAVTRVDSKSQLPEGVKIKRVDFDDNSSLVDALRGQDALIITLAVSAPKDQQAKLIQAAADANVPWILPNEFANDSTHEAMGKDIFVGPEMQKARELISSLGKSSWIALCTGFWFEWSLAIPLAYGFDFETRSVTLFDDGNTPICTSTWPQVGRAVAALLSLPVKSDENDKTAPHLEQFRDGHVYVNSFALSQNDMLDSVLRVSGTRREDWNIQKEPVHDRYAAGMAELQKGDQLGFVKVLYSRLFYPDGCGDFSKTKGLQNDALGLPKEDLDEFTRMAMDRAGEVRAQWSK